jgi:hypothetical protein
MVTNQRLRIPRRGFPAGLGGTPRVVSLRPGSPATYEWQSGQHHALNKVFVHPAHSLRTGNPFRTAWVLNEFPQFLQTNGQRQQFLRRVCV